MRFQVFIVLALIFMVFITPSDAADVSAFALYTSMNAACHNAVAACYAAGGSTWSVTFGLTASPTIVACNAGFVACKTSAEKAAGLVSAIPFI
jgi:hypothetical protein